MKKMTTILASVSALFLLAGCQPKPLNEAAITRVGTVEGCEVTYVDTGVDKHSFYMAKCPAASTTVTNNYTESHGKTSSSRTRTTITQELNDLKVEQYKLERERDATVER